MPTSIDVHQHRSGRPGDPPHPLPAPVRTVPELFREVGYYTFNCGKDDYNFDYDREDLYAGAYEILNFYGARALGVAHTETGPRDWRAQWQARRPGQPFFGQFTLWGGKNPRKPDRPTEPATVTVPPYYPDIPTYREQIASHYDNIRVTDLEVGEIMAALQADGLLEDTIVVFFSDHGPGLLRHKQFCYDGGIHVPLIVAAPPRLSRAEAGSVREDLVSSIDVAATTLAMAGLAAPDWMEGRDVFAPAYGRDSVISARDRCDYTIDRIRSVRTKDYKYVRNFMTDRPLMQRQYRERGAPFTEFRQYVLDGKASAVQAALWSENRPGEELYDLRSDPHETVNLAASPECRAVLETMRKILEEWIEETDDKGQYPEPEASLKAVFDRWGPEKCVNPEYDRFRVP
jgi:arylsulfatase A-like enzyme